MKTKMLTMLLGIMCIISTAQVPQSFSYQAIVRDNAGEILQNQPVGIRISIRNVAADGTVIYQETFNPTTNQFGLVNLEIGKGSPTIGTFAGIDWGANQKFLELEVDQAGGSSYVSIGTSQLISVPYALYSENTANKDDADADPTNELQTLSQAGDQVTLSEGGGTISVSDADNDPTNELQTLSQAGDQVMLSEGGGTISVSDADNDPANELNTSVSLDGTSLKVTDASGTITTDLGSLVDDADANPTNELQTLSQAGDQVTLSEGGGTISVSDADNDPANELQTLSKAGNTVTLSDGGGSFVDETEDADANPTNELQTLSQVGDQVTLSEGGGTISVSDADNDPANELNTSVSLDGTSLKVTDAGGTITTNLGSLVDDADANPANELQTVSKAGNTVTLSDGGGSFVDETMDADADPTNELNTSFNLDGTDLKVTDAGGTITTNLGSLVDDADANPTNELQTVSKAGNTVTLSDGGGSFVDETEDADANPENEIQNLSILGNDLSISDGNTVTLPTTLPTGTTGNTLFHNGTVWEAGSNLFNNGTNVGIGATNPSQKLDVDFGDIIVQGPESFDAIGEQATLYLGTVHNYIKSEYGYGIKIGTYVAPDVLAIKEISGYVGIGTNLSDKSKMGLFTDNKDGSKTEAITHTLTIGNALNDNVLRLVGPLGSYGHGARLNFGDADYAFIEEDTDDNIAIYANRVAFIGGNNFIGNVGIGTTTPHGRAALDIESTTKGFLPPRMTSAQMNEIDNPPEGLMVYNTDLKTPCWFDGTHWININNITSCGGTKLYSGQVYNTVLIGTQCWMAQNLNVGAMINGTTNPFNNGMIEKYCYDDDPAWCEIYGGLYQWDEMMQYATTEGSQGICPDGWHLPADDEWTALENYVSSQSGYWCGGDPDMIAKSLASTTLWDSSMVPCDVGNDPGSNNATGFSGLPGGYRSFNGHFYNLGGSGYWWSSTENSAALAWYRDLYYDYANVSRNDNDKNHGFSVRCLRDY